MLNVYTLCGLLIASVVAPAVSEVPSGLTPAGLIWSDAPAPMPPGTRVAILEGDLQQHGVFTVRFRVPAGSEIEPHWLRRDERVTVLSGRVGVRYGSAGDSQAMAQFPGGSFFVSRPGVLRHLIFLEATEMQVTANGPWELLTHLPQTVPASSASIVIEEIEPLPGRELALDSVLEIEASYRIDDFRPNTFFVTIQFESVKPNQTFGAPVRVYGSNSLGAAPPRPAFLDTSAGRVTLNQELTDVLRNPDLKRPLRIRLFLHEEAALNQSRVIATTEWVEYR